MINPPCFATFQNNGGGVFIELVLISDGILSVFKMIRTSFQKKNQMLKSHRIAALAITDALLAADSVIEAKILDSAVTTMREPLMARTRSVPELCR